MVMNRSSILYVLAERDTIPEGVKKIPRRERIS